MYRRNASASSADTTAATELALFAANDGDLYRSQAQPIITNLAKKMSKGQYDEAKAAKLWGYFANSAAQKYAWEFGDRKRGTRSWREQSIDGNGMFNAATRRFASAELEQHYRDEVTSLATTARLSERGNPRRNGAHSVTVEGTLWRDSFGNTYHRAYCYVDGKHVLTTPITYGYGNQFSYTGWQALADKGIVPALSRTQPPSGAARDAGIVFDTSYTNVKRKKDL
jgi:hypothetical protein